jgi:hypothetical protein
MLMPNPFRRAPRPDPEELDRQARSQAELAAGRLPLSAQERLAEQASDQVFTSALSTRDLVAIRATGYQPVGQVFGTSTFQLSRNQAYLQSNVHGSYAMIGALTMMQFRPVQLNGFHDGEIACRERAVSRMRAECSGYGGDGVIGVRPVRTSLSAGVYEYTLVGTAVRRSIPVPDALPFMTALSAADFGLLIRGGWAPTSLIFSLSRYICHGGRMGGRFTGGWQNRELAQLTDLQTMGQEHARSELHAKVIRSGGTGMLMHDWSSRFEHLECPAQEGARDYAVDVDVLGTGLVQVKSWSAAKPSKLDITPVLRLDRESE